MAPKNTAPNQSTNVNAASNDEWEKEQIGFPPYLKVAVGLAVQAILMNLDATDPNFPRYTFVNDQEEPITCYKGDSEHQEEVKVYQGEQFSLSEYAGISREKLLLYVGLTVRLQITRERKLPPIDGKPRSFFEWELMVKKSDRPLIENRKKQLAEMKLNALNESQSAQVVS